MSTFFPSLHLELVYYQPPSSFENYAPCEKDEEDVDHYFPKNFDILAPIRFINFECLKKREKENNPWYEKQVVTRVELYKAAILELIEEEKNDLAVKVFFIMEKRIFYSVDYLPSKDPEIFKKINERRLFLEKKILAFDSNIFYKKLQVLENAIPLWYVNNQFTRFYEFCRTIRYDIQNKKYKRALEVYHRKCKLDFCGVVNDHTETYQLVIYLQSLIDEMKRSKPFMFNNAFLNVQKKV